MFLPQIVASKVLKLYPRLLVLHKSLTKNRRSLQCKQIPKGKHARYIFFLRKEITLLFLKTCLLFFWCRRTLAISASSRGISLRVTRWQHARHRRGEDVGGDFFLHWANYHRRDLVSRFFNNNFLKCFSKTAAHLSMKYHKWDFQVDT